MKKLFNNIDEYITGRATEIQDILEKIRSTISDAAPDATEVIRYGMPAFRQNGILVYFAAFEHHIGFYCLPSGNKAFKEALGKYKTGKGSIQFPYNKPIPYPLIKKIVKFRLKEDAAVYKE